MQKFAIQVHYYRISKGQQEKDFDFLEVEAMCYKSALIKAKEIYGVRAFAYYYNDVKYKNQDICQFQQKK